MKEVTIVSMSKVYESESFSRPFNYIECSDIVGTNCYADDEAMATLRHRLGNVDARGIHFIDSGNYHYLSYLFLEKIPVDFELVLIDNHPDCKIPMFEGLMSCGGWIREAFLNVSHLKRVYMIGVSDQFLYELDDLGEYKDRVVMIKNHETDALLQGNLPIYLSIDKDALLEEIVNTNWDQGNMNLEELDEWVSSILEKRYLIGADVCGEAESGEAVEVHEVSSEVNEHILSVLHVDS